MKDLLTSNDSINYTDDMFQPCTTIKILDLPTGILNIYFRTDNDKCVISRIGQDSIIKDVLKAGDILISLNNVEFANIPHHIIAVIFKASQFNTRTLKIETGI